MNAHIYVVALWLVAAPWTIQAAELPVVFARSGQKVAIPVVGNQGTTVSLRAFGHQWGEAVAVKGGEVDITPPDVRVPVVFRLIDTNEAVRGDLVVYPKRPVAWKKDMQLVAAATPNWFNTWSDAVGLPVKKFGELNALKAGNWRMFEQRGLMILGARALPGGATAASRLAVEYQINVLVLGTDWFSANQTARELPLSPKQITGPLFDIQSDAWSLPPLFSQHAIRIVNRETWIAGPDHPLIEEIRSLNKGADSLRTVYSFVPWQQQLGRTEVADQLFLRVLRETATGAKDRPPMKGRWRLLYPPAENMKADRGPVLAAAMRSEEHAAASETHVYVLDLRGKTPPPDFFDRNAELKTAQTRIGTDSPLLILGNSPVLDAWRWLKLDRQNQRSSQPGVVWWPDVSLPASMDAELRLMQFFTQWNIVLEPVSQE